MLDESTLKAAIKEEFFKKCCAVKQDDEVLITALNTVVIQYLQSVDAETLKNIVLMKQELNLLIDSLCKELISMLEETIRNYKTNMLDASTDLINEIAKEKANTSKIEEIDLSKLTPATN
ncbi:hypothetical protein [Helicobacter sp. 11S02629-2]|uniref:hypothetical protein n=1 Tax=Helicobacter sp. 11S02629-2 TaxID=1476195 RepID=UPI000BA61884|nr:hypothetical protein [Helicobacter sp. 11S02629-2]PAF44978.1 hypothetical protein BKH40_04645 [Helicobacter sp. 11S02629-2]